MITRKVVCDRCGVECEKVYYTIDIYGHDANPINDGRLCFDAAARNVTTNTAKIFNTEKQFCRKCRESIERFIEGGVPS